MDLKWKHPQKLTTHLGISRDSLQVGSHRMNVLSRKSSMLAIFLSIFAEYNVNLQLNLIYYHLFFNLAIIIYNYKLKHHIPLLLTTILINLYKNL